MTTHTPGPWYLAHEGGSDGGYYIEAKTAVVLLPAGRMCHVDGNLIAAAPDLLAALEDVARWIDTLPEEIRLGSIMSDKLRAAIAKAEGGSKNEDRS